MYELYGNTHIAQYVPVYCSVYCSVHLSILLSSSQYIAQYIPVYCSVYCSVHLSILLSILLWCSSLTTSLHHEPNAVQSRVRRLIGRRRAGLDRYLGTLSREASQPQDSVDPITELLSQLSGQKMREKRGHQCVYAWYIRIIPFS